MRSKSPANNADSSPPVPARISRKMFLSSAASFGNNDSVNSLSMRSISAFAVSISSCAISFISGSASISCALVRSASRDLNAMNIAEIGSMSERSFDNARKRFMSLVADGSDSNDSTSTKRRSSCSSLMRKVSFMADSQALKTKKPRVALPHFRMRFGRGESR